MKTAISVPDKIFREAERVAKRLGVSRSELYTRAVQRLVESFDGDAIRASYDKAFAEPESTADARFRRAAARRELSAVEWDDA